MRRDVVNALTRVRRDLRFVLADRYRALLGSRFVVLTALAAGGLDRAVTLAAIVRRRRRRPAAASQSATALVRGAVTGGDEVSLTLRDVPPHASGVALRRGTLVRPLPTTLDRGTLLRLLATVPAEVCDGEDWTVVLVAGDVHHDIVVTDPAALKARLPARRPSARPSDPIDWPPRLRAAHGILVLRAQAPDVAGLVHTVEVGVRSAIVTWPTSAASAELVLAADESERTFPARVEGGTAQAVVDLHDIGADATWLAYASGPAGRVALQLPRATLPPLDDTGRPHRVPLPTKGATGRAVEVGYSPANQLVVRIGNVAPAAS